MEFDYERDTRAAYQDRDRARVYREQYTTAVRWSRFVMLAERRRVAQELARLGVPAGARLLDCPCGAGLIAPALDGGTYRVVGADVSFEMLLEGMEHFKDADWDGVLRADAARLPFADSSFDVVFCIGLLHRVPEQVRHRILTELRRIARRNVIFTYSVRSRRQRAKLRLMKMLRPGHLPAPCPTSRSAMAEDLRRIGLAISRRCAIVPFFSGVELVVSEKV